MIASVVAAFALLTVVGVLALVVAAVFRRRMAFVTYSRVAQVAAFTVVVGLWGALVGCMFWVAS